ncbi:CDGSH iron-sulfur domain-containing protein [Arthrobacter yangruifuii]|uniref:CDGSH iron-sulfur domain-containing protein n=1 Tax=Arthrobacter yangruifuii TaxID=2606616 RepID=A0A5N6MTG9_9MICC|nr:CDGSH iron-sulfur domain-containing protein [Arthrobacter yangruifuii]
MSAPETGSPADDGSVPAAAATGTDDAAPWQKREGTPPASVVACPNGPLLIRGDFEIVTPDGVPVPRDRETVALCRCGGSAIKPYCDGTHKLMKFDTSRRRPVPEPARRAAEDAAG